MEGTDGMREIWAAQGSGTSPGRIADVRRGNLALVLSGIYPDSRTTRADIAAATGLTKAAVSSLVADLIETGLIEEIGISRDGERGRPGVGLTLNALQGAIGAEINVDYLAAGFVDLHGSLRFHEVMEAENRGRNPAEVLRELEALSRRCVDRAESAGVKLLGGGLAVPGLVDPNRQTIRSAPNLRWKDVDVSSVLGQFAPKSAVGVLLSNEANSAALAELWYGHGRAFASYLFVSGEVGVGGGLVIGSQLYTGPTDSAGEVGHIVVEPGGRRCSCGGRGCLETIAGEEAILEAAGLSAPRLPRASRMTDLRQALSSGNPQAISAVERAGRYLGIAIVSAARLVDVAGVVLGGHFTLVSEWLQPALLDSLDWFAPGLLPEKAIIFSDLGGTAAVRGAAGAGIRRAFADPSVLLR